MNSPNPAAWVHLKMPLQTRLLKWPRRTNKKQTVHLYTRSIKRLRLKSYGTPWHLGGPICAVSILAWRYQAHVRSVSTPRRRRIRAAAVCLEPPVPVWVSSAGLETDTASHIHGASTGRSRHLASRKCFCSTWKPWEVHVNTASSMVSIPAQEHRTERVPGADAAGVW